MLIWKCKYHNACGSPDNCAACRGKKQLIEDDIKKQLSKFIKEIKNEN